MIEFIQKITAGENLTSEESRSAINSIFTDATDAQIGAFLTALKMKGETAEEIAGMAMGMKEAANTINPKVSGTLVDTCGTGGDSSHTINISTASAPYFTAVITESRSFIPQILTLGKGKVWYCCIWSFSGLCMEIHKTPSIDYIL